MGFKASDYDLYKILSVTGGIPWYLEQIKTSLTADENLKQLAFQKGGLFTLEADLLFHDLFDSKKHICKQIVYLLAAGMKTQAEIRHALDYPQSGSLSDFIKMLITSGFITQHSTWSFKSKVPGKSSLYRLSDNYLRFFIKYIEPNRLKIQKNEFQDFSLSQLPGWDAMMGFQIENLLIKNRKVLLESLGIHPVDVEADNPFIQSPKRTSRGCHIDYLIKTKTKNLYLCEFKFKRNLIGTEVILEMKEKEKSLSIPRGFATIPVLFHLGDVSDAVYESNYFYRMVDIADFLR